MTSRKRYAHESNAGTVAWAIIFATILILWAFDKISAWWFLIPATPFVIIAFFALFILGIHIVIGFASLFVLTWEKVENYRIRRRLSR